MPEDIPRPYTTSSIGNSGESMPRNRTAPLSSPLATTVGFGDEDDVFLHDVEVSTSNPRVFSSASTSNDDRSSDDDEDEDDDEGSFTGNRTHPLLTRTVRNTGDDGNGLDTYGMSNDRSMDDMCISPSFVPGAYSSTFNVPSRFGWVERA
jgi:hypothetical protein